MTAPPSVDLPGWQSEQLGRASPDLLREMITTFVQGIDGCAGRRGPRRRVGRRQPRAGIRSCGRGRSFGTGCSSVAAGAHTLAAADALSVKVREGGRIVNIHALLRPV
jgi:hypothetical protein